MRARFTILSVGLHACIVAAAVAAQPRGALPRPRSLEPAITRIEFPRLNPPSPAPAAGHEGDAPVAVAGTPPDRAASDALPERREAASGAVLGVSAGLIGGVHGCVEGAVVAGLSPAVFTGTSIPPLDVAPAPMRLHAGMQRPRAIDRVEPIYPRIAEVARIEGIVVLDATIGEDGRVVAVAVLRSPPTLARAAERAVRSWRFTPTLVNGVPAAIVMTVTVTFSLPNH